MHVYVFSREVLTPANTLCLKKNNKNKKTTQDSILLLRSGDV
jgi:hypothetical protein